MEHMGKSIRVFSEMKPNIPDGVTVCACGMICMFACVFVLLILKNADENRKKIARRDLNAPLHTTNTQMMNGGHSRTCAHLRIK